MKRCKRKLLLFAMTLVLANIGALFISTPSLAADAQWVDASTIKIGDQLFTDSNLDNNYTFKYHHESCDDTIVLTRNGDGRPNVAQGTLTRYSYNPINKGCVKGQPEHVDFEPSTMANSDIQFYWVNPQTISTSDHKTFTRYDGQGQFNGLYFRNGDSCPDAIRANADHKTGTFTEYHSPSGNIGPIPIPFGETNGCNQGDSKNIDIFKLENAPNGDAAHDGTTTPPGSSNNSCNVPYISWIVCPLIEVGYKVIGFLERLVSGMLIAPDVSPLEPIWAAFRNLANVIFVLLFLIIIFSNMLSIHLDAYTVKKLLPKLVAAAILVQFSFMFSKIAIDISNVTGAAIHSGANGLIPAVGKTQNDVPSVSAGLAELGGGTAGLVFGAIVAPEIWIGIIITIGLLILSGLISLLVVAFTLSLRLVFLEMFVVLSPIAFALWVLPNTEKYFKDWLENFIKLLLMYPIIRLLFIAGGLINQVINNNQTAGVDYTNMNNVAVHLAATIAPIATFAAVPAVVALTGKFINKVTGGSIGKAGSFGKNLNAGLGKNVRAGVKEAAAVKYLGSDKSKASQRLGRVLTGNVFSFGAPGKRKIAATAAAARSARFKDLTAGFEENGYANKDLMKIAEAHLNGEKSFDLGDGKGPQKLLDGQGEAAIAYMGSHGGDLEIAKLLEGKVYGTAQPKATVEDEIDPATGQKTGRQVTKWSFELDDKQKAAKDIIDRGLILGGAKGTQAKASPHLVKDVGAFGDGTNENVIAYLKGPSGRTGARVAFSMDQAAAQKNLDSLFALTRNQDLAKEVDKETANAYRDEALKFLGANSHLDFNVDDGTGNIIKLSQHLASTISAQGSIQTNFSAKKV